MFKLFPYSLLLFLLGMSSSVGVPIDGRGGSQDITARSDVQAPHKQFEPNPIAFSKATVDATPCRFQTSTLIPLTGLDGLYPVPTLE
jgi:hypothetical protein